MCCEGGLICYLDERSRLINIYFQSFTQVFALILNIVFALCLDTERQRERESAKLFLNEFQQQVII